MTKVQLEIKSLPQLIGIYMIYNQKTQEEFGELLNTNRQNVAALLCTEKSEDINETMLLRLYYYFDQAVKQECNGMESDILELVTNELQQRGFGSSHKNSGKPRSRKRK